MADDDSDLEIIESLPDHIDHGHRPAAARRRRPIPRRSDSVAANPIEARRQARSHSDQNFRFSRETRRHMLQQAAMAELNNRPDAAQSRPQAADGNVIDLTEEPDSPPRQPPMPLTLPRVVMAGPNGMPARRNVGFLDVVNNSEQQQERLRNPRRQPSGLGRTPSFSRSDPSMIGGRGRSNPAQLVDLTAEDDAPAVGGPAPARQRARAPGADAPANRPWAGGAWGGGAWAGGALHVIRNLVGMGLGRNVGNLDVVNPGSRVHGAQAAAAQELRNFRQMELNMDQLMGGDLQRDVLIQLDYGNPGAIHPSFWEDHSPNRPKPPYVPPPDAPEGFSRSTGEDIVSICPGCDEELVYDPDEVQDNQDTPAKKPRSKKDRAEYHFMFVKACGHVYCRVCYERRTPTSGRRGGSVPRFRPHPDSSTKLLCAVEDCDSEVKSKIAWLGVFL